MPSDWKLLSVIRGEVGEREEEGGGYVKVCVPDGLKCSIQC